MLPQLRGLANYLQLDELSSSAPTPKSQGSEESSGGPTNGNDTTLPNPIGNENAGTTLTVRTKCLNFLFIWKVFHYLRSSIQLSQITNQNNTIKANAKTNENRFDAEKNKKKLHRMKFYLGGLFIYATIVTLMLFLVSVCFGGKVTISITANISGMSNKYSFEKHPPSEE